MGKYKKSCLVSILSIFILALFSTCVYAASGPVMGNSREIDNAKEYTSSKQAKVTGTPRGRLLSSVDIELTDKGGGTMEVYADMFCHEPMKELRMWLYLEKWISEEEVWESIQYEQFSWEAKDFPDQDLTIAIANYEIPNLERGQDYRVRGLFGADALTSSLSEAWTIKTPNFFME